ncbi:MULTISPECIES: CopG family transcriptional regulator [unclassified Duganella]|jgi:predicted transcriptional regulator|uniref:CopG family transcriptional regulator n=1 Tax=unclassified Duganella TaxID=2636909 RepID=UPI00111451AD|nr:MULTISPECIES: CopG family transcriptional regulator [unclassified Duganella]
MSKSATVAFIVQLETALKRKLEAVAEARGQAADDLASEAIALFLEQADSLTPAEKAARQSWEHYKTTGLHLTMAEADAWLSELEGGQNIEPPPCHR